jgi:hypothetical protein
VGDPVIGADRNRIRWRWVGFRLKETEGWKNVRRRGLANAFSGGGWYPNTPPESRGLGLWVANTSWLAVSP